MVLLEELEQHSLQMNTQHEHAKKPMARAPMKTISDARHRVSALPDVQRRIFLLMCDFWTANDQLPSMSTIAQRMGYSSVNAAQQAVAALVSKGLLERNESQRLRFRRVEGMNLGEVFRHKNSGRGL